MSNDAQSTVHQAMTRAAQEAKSQRVRLMPFTFKLDPEKVSVAAEICERNGTTMPAFMRHVLECLIDDYCPPKRKE